MIEIKHRDTGAVLGTVNAETLRGADLYWADRAGANLSGVKWGNTMCPDGTLTDTGC